MSLVLDVSSELSTHEPTKSLIVLVGLMGSGKTTVGRELAKKLNLQFADSDELIEKSAKLSVREIFVEKGEPEFRRLESEALVEACDNTESMVMAVAGGAVVSDSNRALLLSHARCIVWLDAPTSTLVGRTGRAKHRPLLDGDPVGALNQMRTNRESFYQQIATHKISTQSLTVAQVVDTIIDQCQLTKIIGVSK